MLRKPTPLQTALLVSVGAHALLLGWRGGDPSRPERVVGDQALEVILVNARSAEPPERAEAIAQASLGGGGSLERGRSTSPMPPSATLERGDATEDTTRRTQSARPAERELLARLQPDPAALPMPEPEREAGPPEADAREERRRDLMQLLAEIDRRTRDESQKPKKRYISPATREEAYALYYDRLRRRIEDRGTRDFPENQGRKLYGELTMNVTVDADGRLVDAEVAQSSGSPLLDRRAIAIVRAAGPFGRFTDAMRRRADQLVISSRFRFTRDEGLEATLAAPTEPSR